MARSVKEWIGKTDDARVPPRVRLRIFERHNGVCHISGRKIMAGDAWDLDHVVALINGGEHRESNLAPALKQAHRGKTARDIAQKAKSERIRKRAAGIQKPRAIRSWRRFDGSPVHASRER